MSVVSKKLLAHAWYHCVSAWLILVGFAQLTSRGWLQTCGIFAFFCWLLESLLLLQAWLFNVATKLFVIHTHCGFPLNRGFVQFALFRLAGLFHLVDSGLIYS